MGLEMQSDGEILAEAVVKAASMTKKMIVTAESCTGGMVAAALTDITGSSGALDRGFVTYSNAAKMDMIGVKASTLKAFGAVSPEVAGEMAVGALAAVPNATLSVAITGIAGPGGGSADKPVGLVHFASLHRGFEPVLKAQIFTGDRAAIRKQATAFALNMLQDLLAVDG